MKEGLPISTYFEKFKLLLLTIGDFIADRHYRPIVL
jgi:hypothetical protein